MKKIALIIPMVFLISCGEEIQRAKMSSALFGAAIEMTQSGIDASDNEKAKSFFSKLKPQLWQAKKTLDSAILAAEQYKTGNKVDLVTPVKDCVCLLLKARVWLKPSWQSRIDAYVKLIGVFVCGSEGAKNLNITIDQAKQLQAMMFQLTVND